jgi:integrative and conjugative element protein (TIGR02256 family)
MLRALRRDRLALGTDLVDLAHGAHRRRLRDVRLELTQQARLLLLVGFQRLERDIERRREPLEIDDASGVVSDGLWQQEQLDEIYVRSGRIQAYLGDWHSQPDGLLRPSRRDRSTAKAVAKTREARTPNPLTIIGIDADERWHWGVLRYRGRRGFERLGLRAYGEAGLQP